MIKIYDELIPESPVACAGCDETFPDSALDSNGLCQECCFHRHLESQPDDYYRDDVSLEIYEL